jgi:hypothetical protein
LILIADTIHIEIVLFIFRFGGKIGTYPRVCRQIEALALIYFN